MDETLIIAKLYADEGVRHFPTSIDRKIFRAGQEAAFETMILVAEELQREGWAYKSLWELLIEKMKHRESIERRNVYGTDGTVHDTGADGRRGSDPAAE